MGNGDYRGISNEPPAGYWADTIADEEREAEERADLAAHLRDEGDLPAHCVICEGVTNLGTTICDICAADLRRFARECQACLSVAEVMAEYDLSLAQAETAMRQAGLRRV